jgi:hypothetical protein
MRGELLRRRREVSQAKREKINNEELIGSILIVSFELTHES